APHWMIEHGLLLLEIYLLSSALSDTLRAAAALGGVRADHVFRDLYRFSSILDFWARYNQPVHHFLRERVYQPLRGRLGPRGAILATFFASGLFHEYIFVSVDPRLLGIQLGFFAIQGLGGLGEQGLRRLFGVRRRAPWLARAGSWA